MKANNTLNVSDLTNWINFQLSTIIEGVSAGYTLGNNNTVWIDRGATVFTVSLATGEEIEIDSDNYATAEDIAKAIISAVNKNTPSTSDTMNTETKTMNEVNELSNAGYCLDVYLNNTAEIYKRYTVPAIAECVKSMSAKSPAMLELVKKALQAATRLVIKHDRITPTADDIRTVFNNYLGYIIDCAEFEIKNA